MNPEPGQVFPRPDRPDSLIVVLSSAEDDLRTGRVTVCAYGLTGQIGNLPAAAPLHSLTPSPGYITWTIHHSLPASSLRQSIGTAETAAPAAARSAMEACFS